MIPAQFRLMNFPNHGNYLQYLSKCLFLAEGHCNEHSTKMHTGFSLKSSFAWCGNIPNKSVLPIKCTGVVALAAFFTRGGVHQA